MSTNAKVIMWIIIAVIVVGGGFWLWTSINPITVTAPTYTTPTSTTPTVTATTTPSSTAATTPTNDISASANDNSNAALQADLAKTDAQMNGFTSDNTSINNSMNDQAVQQSQY